MMFSSPFMKTPLRVLLSALVALPASFVGVQAEADTPAAAAQASATSWGGFPLKVFDFHVSWESHSPDGFSRQMLLVNHQFPGPQIEAEQDDWVVVRVKNDSPFNTTVHFHGIEMHGTPWSDGVPGVTQHPIQPGRSFIYTFQATQYGSYWYHSHQRGQIEDGLLGPIVIHPRKNDPKPFSLISKDPKAISAMIKAERNVKPLVISDVVHLTSLEKWDLTVKSSIEDPCYDSITFNGKGSVQCLDKDEVYTHLGPGQIATLGLVPGANMTDKSCFPVSVINAFGGGEGKPDVYPHGVFDGCKSTNGSVEVVTVEGHGKSCKEEKWVAFDIIGSINFIVGSVAIDEHDMWIYAMDGSYIQPQKVQVLTVTNGDRFSVLVKLGQSGDFKIRCNASTQPQMIIGHAILRVQGANPIRRESKSYIDIAGLPLSNTTVLFNQDIAAPFPPQYVPQKADELHVLDMRLDGASYLWALNNTRLMPTDLDSDETPILFHPDPTLHNNVTLSTRNNTWVDLVFLAATFPMPPHPIHKHGNKMFQIGTGTGPFKWRSVDEAIREVPKQFNLVNPPQRDTFATPLAMESLAWNVVRYHVTNPGAWLLHCHISNHMMGGMMMVIQDGVDAWPKIPLAYAE